MTIIQPMLDQEGARAVTLMALIETLLIDLERTSTPKTRRHNAIRAMQEKLIVCNDTYTGKVGEDFITYCDRFLCRVQDATDNFFDEITEHDLLEMERVKSSWPQHAVEEARS